MRKEKAMPRRSWVIALLLFVVAGTALGTLAVAIARQTRDDPPEGLEDVPRRISTVVVIEGMPARIGPPSTPSNDSGPRSCGTWADASIAGTAGFALASRYGELRYCFRHGDTWVITTLGKKGRDGVREGGVVALYRCDSDDKGCLSNANDHPFSGWTVITPPYSGAVTVLNVLDDGTLVLGVGNDRGGKTFELDVETREWQLIGSSQSGGR